VTVHVKHRRCALDNHLACPFAFAHNLPLLDKKPTGWYFFTVQRYCQSATRLKHIGHNIVLFMLAKGCDEGRGNSEGLAEGRWHRKIPPLHSRANVSYG